MPSKRLLVYGDIEMDIIVKISSLSQMEEDAEVNDVIFSPGGSAANCSVVASSLGLPTTFLGTIGIDYMSNMLQKDLRKYKVNTKYLKKVDGSPAACISVVDHQGNRKFYSYRGVNEQSQLASIPNSFMKKHHCLHLTGYSFQDPNSRNNAMRLINAAKSLGFIISLDPSYLFSKNLDIQSNDLLQKLDYFFPNREEAYQLTHIYDPVKAAQVIREHGPKVVIITLDKEGCFVLGEGINEFVTFNNIVDVSDTTGAGDAFCGGFLMGILNDLTLIQACKVGSAAASHIITRLGGHEYAPKIEEIIKIIRNNNQEEFALFLEKKFYG
jgi:sugar/nucleoside kinase (ribokinase family)